MPLSLLLALSADKPISGELLAEQFGCTRAAISKRISSLKDLGVLIDAFPRVGYQLGFRYSWWNESELRSSFKGFPALTDFHVLQCVDSTNIWMRERISRSGAGEIHLSVTDFQGHGQGRRGRQWMSLPGRQIIASLGVSSTQGPIAWVGVAVAVGLSLAVTLRQHGWPVELKWPNDLWLDGRKLGGILVEMDAMAEGPSSLVVGYGINELVLSSEQELLGRPVAALQDISINYDRHLLFAALSKDLVRMLSEFSSSGLAPWQEIWPAYDALAGRMVSFEHRGEWREGLAKGIDAQGALLILCGSEMVRCHSGEVSVRVNT